MVEIGKKAVEFGADSLSVDFMEEGIKLRKVTDKPIYILREAPFDKVKQALNNNLILMINSFDIAKKVSQRYSSLGRKLPVQIKVDMGMNRIGINFKNAIAEIDQILNLNNLIIKSIFTHFSCAEGLEDNYTDSQ